MQRSVEKALNEGRRKQIDESLRQKYGHSNFTVTYSVKPEILGGLQIYFGDSFLDCSLITRINKIKNELSTFTV